MRVVRMSISCDGPFVTERACPRAGAQPRRHVHQAVKERRLLHTHPTSRIPPTHAHLRMLMSHSVQAHRTQQSLTAKAYMSLRKHPIHHVHAGVLFLIVSCVYSVRDPTNGQLDIQSNCKCIFCSVSEECGYRYLRKQLTHFSCIM